MGDKLLYSFEDFVLDTDQRELCRGARPIALQPQVFDLLEYLVTNRHRVISRDDIIEAVWGGRIVSESALTTRINAVRTAVSDSGEEQRLIRTLPRKGFRFVGAVREAAKPAEDAVAAAESTQSMLPTVPSAAFADKAAPAERRQLTVASCELLPGPGAGRMDPEDFRDIVQSYRACVADLARRYDGFVANLVGNTAFVYFGYPLAHEDDAERAVRAGLDLVVAVTALQSPVPLQARVGIATGLVVVGDPSGGELGIVGETPNVAARLHSFVEPNTVVVGESARRFLGALFALQDLGMQHFKGTAEPLRAFAVLRPSAVESRFEALRTSGLTDLVGRHEELELLLRRWSRAKAGQGQVVLLSGEPGIGKSRLTVALLDSIATEPHTRLRYFCSPQHADSVLYPIIGQLERAAGFAHDDAPRAKLDKLDVLLAPTSTSADDAALLAEMLSLQNDGRYPASEPDPQKRRQRTLEALIAQMAALSRSKPVLMIFEDVHWIDPTSLEALGRTVERSRGRPVLLIVTYRPEFVAPWVGQPHVMTLTVNRLSEREVSSMIDRVASSKALRPDVLSDIVERSDGIPLFVEEITKAVLEAEDLKAVEAVVASVPSPALAVPTTLHASLMARLDRLGSAKVIAQIGSAIGRAFSHALIATVARKPEAELQGDLDRLIVAGLLFRQGVPPHATYQFKHALVQDVAYTTLLKHRRHQLHSDIASAIAEQTVLGIEGGPEILAYHYSEAGLFAEAIDYWLKAAQRAAMRSAYVEAIAHLRSGLELSRISKGDVNREIDLQLAVGAAYIAARGYASKEAEGAFLAARRLLSGINDAERMEQALHGLEMVTYNRADFGSSLSFSQQELRLAEQRDDPSALCAAHKNMAASLHSMGQFGEAFAHAESAMTLLRKGASGGEAKGYAHDFGIAGMGYYALSAWHRGLFGASADAAESALAAAESSKQTNTGAYGRHYAVLRAVIIDDRKILSTRTSALLDFSEEYQLPHWIAWGTCYRGLVSVHEGSALEAIETLRAGLRLCDDLGNRAFRPLFLSFLASAQAMAGMSQEAIATLEEAISTGEATGERWYAAELWRHKGSLYEKTASQADEAEGAYRKAISIAQNQGSLCFELRSSMNLAKHWRDRGKPAEARDLLARVYNLFREGFHTPDLKQAKKLLRTLAS
jgi:predicted ATPase/DNA-binding winged helix-turn-helix (wHTH) protein